MSRLGYRYRKAPHPHQGPAGPWQRTEPYEPPPVQGRCVICRDTIPGDPDDGNTHCSTACIDRDVERAVTEGSLDSARLEHGTHMVDEWVLRALPGSLAAREVVARRERERLEVERVWREIEAEQAALRRERRAA